MVNPRAAKKVCGYWFEFARSGQPTANRSLEWPAHTAEQDSTMLLGPTIESKKDFMKAHLDVFAAIANLGGLLG